MEECDRQNKNRVNVPLPYLVLEEGVLFAHSRQLLLVQPLVRQCVHHQSLCVPAEGTTTRNNGRGHTGVNVDKQRRKVFVFGTVGRMDLFSGVTLGR